MEQFAQGIWPKVILLALMWSVFGPVIAAAFLRWDSPIGPKYQGHKLLGVERQTWESVVFLILGGPGAWLVILYLVLFGRD